MTTSHLRSLLAADQPALGTFVCEFFSSGVGPLAAQAGADWVLFDLEHSGHTLDAARGPIAVARRSGIATFVRVPGAVQHLVSTALDAGAEGIMVPWVNSVQEAAQIAAWIKYPPVGRRGSAFGMAHDLYAPGAPADKQAQANEETMFLPQIETPQAVAAAAEIAAVDGVDVLFVGPLDLSTNLGVPGQFTHPQMLDALQTVAQAAQDHGKAAGIFAATMELAELARGLGFTVISHTADTALFSQALSAGLNHIRGL